MWWREWSPAMQGGKNVNSNRETYVSLNASLREITTIVLESSCKIWIVIHNLRAMITCEQKKHTTTCPVCLDFVEEFTRAKRTHNKWFIPCILTRIMHTTIPRPISLQFLLQTGRAHLWKFQRIPVHKWEGTMEVLNLLWYDRVSRKRAWEHPGFGLSSQLPDLDDDSVCGLNGWAGVTETVRDVPASTEIFNLSRKSGFIFFLSSGHQSHARVGYYVPYPTRSKLRPYGLVYSLHCVGVRHVQFFVLTRHRWNVLIAMVNPRRVPEKYT